MKIKIIDLQCQNKGSLDLPESIYGLQPRMDILLFVKNWQLSKRRSGCHKTKGISEISGTTRKPYKQKGTGRARQGSLRSPQFRGGAVIFGPVVRSHEFKVNKKVRTLALKFALSSKVIEEKLMVIDDIRIDAPSTKQMISFINEMGFSSVLFICSGSEHDNNFKLSVANIKNANYLSVNGLNVYDILRHDFVVIDKNSIDLINGRLNDK